VIATYLCDLVEHLQHLSSARYTARPGGFGRHGRSENSASSLYSRSDFTMLHHVYVENPEDVGGREDASFVVANSETTTTGRGSAKRDVHDRPCPLRISYNSLATPLAICSSEFNL
jgi:hypothetical protein